MSARTHSLNSRPTVDHASSDHAAAAASPGTAAAARGSATAWRSAVSAHASPREVRANAKGRRTRTRYSRRTKHPSNSQQAPAPRLTFPRAMTTTSWKLQLWSSHPKDCMCAASPCVFSLLPFVTSEESPGEEELPLPPPLEGETAASLTITACEARASESLW